MPLYVSAPIDEARVTAYWLAVDADDTNSFSRALATGLPVYVPRRGTDYVIENLSVPSNSYIYGRKARITLPATSLNPMFNLGSSSDVEITGLKLLGNKSTQTSASSGSVGIKSVGGSNLKLHHLDVRDFTRHLISLDGVTDADVSDNYLDGSYYGCGVLCSVATASRRVTVKGNTVKNTQQGNIQAFVQISQWTVTGNVCDTTNAGSGDTTSGNVADNITGYDANNFDITITGNICYGSGNNGIHVGGDKITVTGNTVEGQRLYGILVSKKPNEAPISAILVTVTGNTVRGTDRTDSSKLGISVREAIGAVVSGNTISNTYSGVELFGFVGTGTAGVQSASVTGNSIDTVSIGVVLQRRCSNCIVTGNAISRATDAVQIMNYSGDAQSSPCFYNLIAHNTFRTITRYFVYETAGDFNVANDNYETDATATYSLIGAGSYVNHLVAA